MRAAVSGSMRWPGSQDVGQGDADDHGRGRERQGQAEGAQAHAADLAEIAQTGDGQDQGGGDQGNDEQEHEAQENLAEGFGHLHDDPLQGGMGGAHQQIGGASGAGAQGEAGEDFQMQGILAGGEFGGPSWVAAGGVSGAPMVSGLPGVRRRVCSPALPARIGGIR